MKNKQFGGIMPAFITPFDENGARKDGIMGSDGPKGR